MCGRFALKTLRSELINQFELDECAEYLPNGNIPPGTDIPVIRFSPEGRRVLHLLRWGLIPHWAKDPGIGAKLNNARGETVQEKPSFREAFKKRRSLIPADGFYEWKTEGKTKQPYYVSLASNEPMAMAGLWESWRAPDGTIVRTACVITTAANALMAPIHERMPVIIAPDQWLPWLAGLVEDVEKLVVPCPAELLQTWPVKRVGEEARQIA
jgi:putative SOS response-associated peptidase YedK